MWIDTTENERICLNANIADKLSVSAGSQNTPVYFENGIPVACDMNTKADAIQEKVDSVISMDNSAYAPLKSLRVFGKTIQNGTPTPENPVELISAGDGGSVTVYIGASESDTNPQALLISTPNGLLGIPVSSDGNYTDENGQQWICDEVDFARGKYVQRIKTLTLTGNENWSTNISVAMHYQFDVYDNLNGRPINPIICTHYPNKKSGDSFYATDEDFAVLSADGERLRIKDARYMNDLEGFKEMLSQKYASGDAVIVTYALNETIETPLSAEQLTAYAALHTNYPNTTIYNDCSMCMEVKYYTPITAVPMIHNPFDEGKIFTIDEYGCVVLKDGGSIEGIASAGDYLPLSAGEDYKLTGPLGLTEEVNYGQTLPESGFKGQLFFLEDSDYPLPSGGNTGEILIKNSPANGDAYWGPAPQSLPSGGSKGQALIKNSTDTGDASWQDIVALPKGGTTGQVLVKNSGTDGDAIWSTNINGSAATASKLGTKRTIQLTGSVTGSGKFDGSGDLNITTTTNHSHDYLPLSGGAVTGDTSIRNVKFLQSTVTAGTTSGTSNTLYIYGTTYGNDETAIQTAGKFSFGDPGPQIVFGTQSNNTSGQRIALIYTDHNSIHSGNSLSLVSTETTCAFIAPKVYGAVYNDYAEYRAQKEAIDPGYCVASTDNGQVYKTTEKFQACDGIVSDTFGFAIGETCECKTPLAVAGRVLAYCAGDRKDYHSGDAVCAGPGGLVYKMTREEIREWPDRIVGIVSEIPEYEIWGSEDTPVDGRIWIKVK